MHLSTFLSPAAAARPLQKLESWEGIWLEVHAPCVAPSSIYFPLAPTKHTSKGAAACIDPLQVLKQSPFLVALAQ